MRYHNRQLAAWVLAAVVCPAALAAGTISWWAAGLEVLVLSALLVCVLAGMPEEGCAGVLANLHGAAGTILGTAVWIWNALMAGYAAWLGARAFPALKDSPVIPLTLVALSSVSLHKGVQVSARVSAVLVGFLIALLAMMLGFGREQIDAAAVMNRNWSPDSAALLVLPFSALLLPAGKRKKVQWPAIALGAGIAAACSLVAAREGDLYVAAESISVLGVMERFEAMLSAALAAGAFSLCSLIAAGGLEARKEKDLRSEVLFWITAIAGTGLAERFSPWCILTGEAVFWVVLPAVTLVVAKAKKTKKRC